MKETTRTPRSGRPNSHVLIRAKRSTLDSRALPLSRNETIGYRPSRPLNRNETVRPRDRARKRPLRQRPPNRETLSDCYYHEEASAWAPHGPSNRTGPGTEHDSGEPFSIRPFRLGGLICCRPLSHCLTQRQYRSPPVRPQSPQRSLDSRRQH